MIKEAKKFIYSPLEKGFKKQIKTIKDQGKKYVEVLSIRKLAEEQKPNRLKAISKR